MSVEKRFLLTGVESAPKRSLIRKIKDLGGRAISVQDLKPNEAFILICGEPKWTEKFITACSTGLWILHPDYIERSYASGHWLREDQFEWNTRKRRCLLGSAFCDDRLLEAPRRWRMRVTSGGGKAFQGWNVMILIKDVSNKEVFMRMLTYGGAVVILKRESMNDAAFFSLTHIFVDKDQCVNHPDIVKDLVSHGFLCLYTDYIRDYVAKLMPPKEEDYYVVSPELYQTAAACRRRRLVNGAPLNGSQVEGTAMRKTGEKPYHIQYQTQTRRGARLDALRASVRELMPSAVVNREKRGRQSLKLEPVVVLDSLPKTQRCANSKDGLIVKRLEVGPSLVRCVAGRRDGKTQEEEKEECCSEPQQCNVVFENISSKETFGVSSEIGGSTETRDFKTNDLKRRRIQDDVGLGCKEKRMTQRLLDKSSKSKSDERRLLRSPILKEMTMEMNCIVRIDQQTEDTRLSEKRVKSLSTQPPLSRRQLQILRDVVKRTISPARETQVERNIQNESVAGSAENGKENGKENAQMLTSLSNPASSVVDSRGSVIIKRLSDEISKQNKVELHPSAVKNLSPLKQSNLNRNEMDVDVVDQRCYRKEQKSNLSSDSGDNLHVKQTSLMNSTELLNHNHIETTQPSHSIALNSNPTDLIPSSIPPSEVLSSDSSECLTLNQPTSSNHLERATSNPFTAKESVQESCTVSNHLVIEEAKCTDSDKIHVVKGETKDSTRMKRSPPVSTETHQFSKIVTMLIDACLDADEGARFNGRENVKKFVDAISSFLSPVSYPPSSTLTTLLKILVEERDLDDRLRNEISMLLERILCLHRPISASMKHVYVDALSHVSIQHQNWQLIEHLFRKVIDCSGDGCASNADLLLLRFIVRFVEADFMESKKRLPSVGNGKVRSVRWCLLTQWIWTNEFAAVRSSQFVQLVAVLIASVRLKNHSAQMVVIGLAQKLVAMGAEAWLLSSVVSMETSIVPRDPWMLAVVIAEQLADERTGSDELKLFLETSECDWLAMVVCRTLLDRMNRNGVIENTSIDLRTIMKYFDLRPYEEVSESVDPRIKNECLTPSKSSITSPRPLVKRSQRPKDVNKTNPKGETQLHIACRKNNVERVRELLQTPGIDVNRPDNAGWTPLHEACNKGNVDVVQELLQFKPKRAINSYFTLTDRPATSQSIIRDGAVDVKAVSHAIGITPLHDAVLNGHMQVCRLLIQNAGTELLAVVDKNGRSATDCARTDEMRNFLLEDHSTRKGTVERTLDTSKVVPKETLSSTQSSSAAAAAVENNASRRETTCEDQSSSSLPCQAISSDCSQRYCILVSNLIQFYVSWRRNKISVDDRVMLKELPEHVLRFRRNLLELQNGKLLSGQVIALARLEALADLQLVTDDQSLESV